MRINTGIRATEKNLSILRSVIGQMSDGIWENTRAMEKYWRNLDYGTTDQGTIYLEDRAGVCSNVADFFANKIKQIVKIEIEDGWEAEGLEWSRDCAVHPDYFHGTVTVGDCYQLYELLKGRNTAKNFYASNNKYEVTLTYDDVSISIQVNAISELAARRKAVEEVSKRFKAQATKLPE